jgi:cellulase
MRSTILLSLATLAPTAVNGHAIFQRIRVNDVDQGQLVGVRAPAKNTPVQDVTGDSIACNTNLYSPVLVTIPAGAKVGTSYEHVIRGPQIPNDPDNPIAHSHK